MSCFPPTPSPAWYLEPHAWAPLSQIHQGTKLPHSEAPACQQAHPCLWSHQALLHSSQVFLSLCLPSEPNQLEKTSVKPNNANEILTLFRQLGEQIPQYARVDALLSNPSQTSAPPETLSTHKVQ